MIDLKEALNKQTLSGEISPQWPRFNLKWVEHTAGFDIFDLTATNGGKLALGDNADYLHLFMALADQIYRTAQTFEPLLIAADTGGNRILSRFYTREDREQFKYAYVALGNAVKQLPESALNGKLSFFAEINLESAAVDGFEKEARKAARTMTDETRAAWESLIGTRCDFLKTDLYVFHLLKLYSWGFQIVGQADESASGFHFVRAKRPQPRGASRK